MTNLTLTPQHLEEFKRLNPLNPDLQAVTFDQLMAHTDGEADWAAVRFDEQPEISADIVPQLFALTNCQMNLGWVVFDVVCLSVGAVGLRSTARAQTVAAMAQAAGPVLSKVETIVARMAAEGASLTDLAGGVFDILKAIYNGGCLGAVVSAFTASLSWWDMILYGVTAMATIIAALATDGLAFIAEVVVLLATFGFLVSDSVKAVQACTPLKKVASAAQFS
jgi:hypothetical protein